MTAAPLTWVSNPGRHSTHWWNRRENRGFINNPRWHKCISENLPVIFCITTLKQSSHTGSHISFRGMQPATLVISPILVGIIPCCIFILQNKWNFSYRRQPPSFPQTKLNILIQCLTAQGSPLGWRRPRKNQWSLVVSGCFLIPKVYRICISVDKRPCTPNGIYG